MEGALLIRQCLNMLQTGGPLAYQQKQVVGLV